MKITVNGEPQQVDDRDDTAVELVRERLGLTGAKLVCGAGVCGACTVAVDGTPMVSCLLPSRALEGRAVTTVEGLGGEHPVQRAFAAHDALQCGYCTPGFVIEAAAFMDRWRAEHGDTAPDREVIADALSGHLCRCGAYAGIYAAVAAACTGAYDTAEASPPPRVEAMEKITGRARYTTDIRLDGQLDGVIVRSTVPHAVIGAVQAPPGVTLVELLAADRTVRYVGQPIAAVVGESLDAARAAAELVRVDYQQRPSVIRPTDAQEPDAPVVFGSRAERKAAPNAAEGVAIPARWHGNLRGPATMTWRGGTAARRIERARSAADPNLVSARFTTAAQVHTPLEPHACVAHWDAKGDLHLYVSAQGISGIVREAAEHFGLALPRVHVYAEHVGGGFGGKNAMGAEVVAAAELARVACAPVRAVLDRAEELVDAGSRAGVDLRLDMLANPDGGLSALTIEARGHGGISIGSAVAGLARFMYGNAPRRLRDWDVITNLPPSVPMRGPGGPPMAWALEQAVDEIAYRRGEDPIALRRRWDGNRKRRALYDWATGLPAWADRPAPGSQTGRFRRGLGFAAANWFYFLDKATEVELRVEQGVVVARCGTQDVGNGSRSVIAEVLRAELGLPAGRVRVEVGTTDAVHGPMAAGSRITASIGPAATDAARRLRTALAAPAGSVADLLDTADGVRVTGKRRRDRGGYLVPFGLGDVVAGRGFAGAVHVTEVEVDTRLGKVRTTRVWGGLSVGRIYNQDLARSQCAGAIIQGVGYALYEQRQVDPHTGVVLTDNLEDYRIPGIGDMPEVDIHFHEEGWEHVTGRGVGLGEVAGLGVAASIGNAIHAATGWRPHDLPVRPDRLLEGLSR